MLRSLAVCICALVAATAAPADQITITPSQDTSIYSEGGILSNGGGPDLFSGRTNNGNFRRALMQFDVAGAIPAGSTITSVELTLTVTRETSGLQSFDLHPILASWGEQPSAPAGGQGGTGAIALDGDATWDHRFINTSNMGASTFWTTSGGDYSSTPSATANANNGSFTYASTVGLVADAQFWLDNPASNFGWILIGDETNDRTAKRYGSRENPNASLRPMLTIEFTPPAATGACCMPAGACVVASMTDCTNMGGTYQGDGTSCTPNPCPQPTGACCLPDGSCVTDTMGNCVAMGGTYQGDGVACAPELCPLVLEPFVDPLPIPAPATPVTGTIGGVAEYDVFIQQVTQQLHRDLPPTTLWTYNGLYPGPTFEALKDAPITVNWINDLRDEFNVPRTDHLLDVDPCPHGAEDVAKTTVHLHGGHVPQEFDGYPEITILPGQTQTFVYPNNQDAATLWYHDHALGITRLNVYAGLAGFYLIRDANENALGLPSGQYEVPLAIQDRQLNPDGSLEYPSNVVNTFFGDFMLVNGKVWPFLEVDQGKYRFRVLNGCGSRTLTLSLSNGGTMTLIGVEGGLRETPLDLTEITLSPAERADIIIDFSAEAEGTEIVLQNSAPAPFPGAPGVGVVPDVMKFVVTHDQGFQGAIPANLRTITPLDPMDAVETRELVMQRFAEPCAGAEWLINEMHWDHITEQPRLNTVEIWEFVNRSGMMHPMHMHLVFFQVLNRQNFIVMGDDIIPDGPIIPPLPEEAGWKDTVQTPPNQITRVIVRFETYQGLFPYHCHILEHEDHEMMRQFKAIPFCDGDITTTGTGAGDPGYGQPDNQTNLSDLLYFVNIWNADLGSPTPNPLTLADVTTTGSGSGDPMYGRPDGDVDLADLLYFVNQWNLGLTQCP